MDIDFRNVLNTQQLSVLSSMIQVGDAAYRDLMEDQNVLFAHPYFKDIRGRIRTKLVQIQCELESHDPAFPFELYQRSFDFGHIIPELHTDRVILHIARSSSADSLPYSSSYKLALSYNNSRIQRQLMFAPAYAPPYADAPLYGLVVFGGRECTFSVVQFPEPGFAGIAETILIPQISRFASSSDDETFERKKAVLKKEFLAHEDGEVIS